MKKRSAKQPVASQPGDVVVNEQVIAPGQRERLEIPFSRLPTEGWMAMPVEVVNGKADGPRLWLSGAVHGDELNGIEIIRRVLSLLDVDNLKGAVISVPIVNVFGFLTQSRYLPDRRDLNRSFPGSARGSLTGRLANLFMTEIVTHCTHGIDLHTGSNHRTNLPQIRGDLSVPETRRCAEAFCAPVILDTHTRDGSLREAASRKKIPVLLYEAGEPLRFDEEAIAIGVEGVFRVMHELGMWSRGKRKKRSPSRIFSESTWVRARRSGILRLSVQSGDAVTKQQELGVITDAFGDNAAKVRATKSGLIIGHVNNPLVNQGDGLVHIAHEPNAE